jgi:hypothetical protein
LGENEEFEEGVWGGFVCGMGVEEVVGGWASGVVDDFEEGVEVMGIEFAVMGAEFVVAVVSEGWRFEFKSVKPLEGGSGGRWVKVEGGGEDGGVGEGAGGGSVGEDVGVVGGSGSGEVVSGVAVRAEEEGGVVKVSGSDEGKVSKWVDSLVVEEELAGVCADIGRKGGVEGEGVEGAAREGAPYAIMGWNCTGRGGERWLPRIG